MEGEYSIKVLPIGTLNNWRECARVEAVITLEVDNQVRIYKGQLELTALKKV